jgi:cysteine desulfurase
MFKDSNISVSSRNYMSVKKIYLDNSASTRVDDEVVRAMTPYFTEVYGNPSSTHQYGQWAKHAI